MSTDKPASPPPSDVAFTPTVKEVQERRGSRAAYAQMERRGGWATRLTPDLVQFVSEQRSLFLATANASGQPYVQHRGGPPGFLHVLDDTTLAIADFRGNRQFISEGNLRENPLAFLFLIDYVHRRRVKLWGHARFVDDDQDLLAALMPSGYAARADRALVFKIEAWDANCPQHIPQRFEAEDVARLLAERDARIAELEETLKALQARIVTPPA